MYYLCIGSSCIRYCALPASVSCHSTSSLMSLRDQFSPWRQYDVHTRGWRKSGWSKLGCIDL